MDQYWAKQDVEEFVPKVISEITEWDSHCATINSGLPAMWHRNTMAYYSTILEADDWETSLSFQGNQGELVKMVIPRARKLVRQVLGIVTSRRLDFQAVAVTSDMESLFAARIANALASQITQDQNLGMKGEQALEESLVLGSAYLKICWRTDRGKPFTAGYNGDDIQYTGDVSIEPVSLYNMIFDRSRDFSDLDTVTIRTFKNKWDLISQHPDLEEDILKVGSEGSEKDFSDSWWMSLRSNSREDLIPVYETYHKPTPALPKGRMTMFSNSTTVYHDGENLYGCLPVEAIIPEKIMGTSFGYPMLSDILPAQEMFDHSYSAIATNQSATAVQSYTVAHGSDLSAVDIDGMQFISYMPQNVPGGGKPEPLQLTQSAPETFKFADMVEGQMMKMANLNNALIGEPNPGVTAGNAIATLTYNALRFMDPYIKGYSKALENSMTKAIKFYSLFATEDMTVAIVGKNKRTKIQQFKGSNLLPVHKMKLQVQSPLMETIGGRLDIAEKIQGWGVVKDVQSLVSILEGAPLDTLIDDELTENDAIDIERDMILDGERRPLVVMTQDHPRHIRSLGVMLNDQQIQADPEKVSLITELITEHLQLEKTMDPMLKAIIRTGQAPQNMPPPPQQGGNQPSPEVGQEVMEQGMQGPEQAIMEPAGPADPLI